MRKWDGTTWSTVGSPGFIAGYFVALAVDNSSTPYVAIGDASLGLRASVLRYTGATPSGWEPVGQQGQLYGTSTWSHLAFDANNRLYYAYQDSSAGVSMAWGCEGL